VATKKTKKALAREPLLPAVAPAQLDAMFSPATFYDAIHADPASAPANNETAPRPPVIAFYGLKGGAGRTTALAHVGALLAERGARVVALDLDLEAPGLDVVAGVKVPDGFDGTATLLRSAIVLGPEESLDARSSLLPVELDVATGAMWVLPAGRLDDRYLATIEELNLHAWSSLPPPQPLQRVISSVIASDVMPDIVFLDCRPGFHPLSAVALFHVADTVVVFLPISPQIWDGLDLLVKAVAKAREIRGGRPDLLLVPALVPPDPVGQPLLSTFVEQLEKHLTALAQPDDSDMVEDPDEEHPWLAGSIGYDASLATIGCLDTNLRTTTWTRFRPLAEALGAPLNLRIDQTTKPLDVSKVLREIDIDSKVAFGEEVAIDDLVDTFVAPGDLARLLDRSNALVVGAKGAGKTWLFRYLVGKTQRARPYVSKGMTYVVGHAPASVNEKGPLYLSKEALKELEKSGKMPRAGTHIAFWRLCASAAICQKFSGMTGALLEKGKLPKGVLRPLLEATSAEELQSALASLVVREDIGTLSASLLRTVDEELLARDSDVTLVYDGLDTGFDVGVDADARQDRFVKALLQLVLERRDLRRIHLKVFLREDLFSRVEMQNKSHLEAAKVELRWRAIDLWRMALVRARESNEYKRFIAGFPGGLEDPGTIVDEALLRRLLDPLWGATVQGARKARTAFYIQKRTSDAAGRLFPRTLMQLLSAAVAEEVGANGVPRDRVLRFPAIRKGVDRASDQRVDDLVAEYEELAPYLRALKGRNPTGTQSQFIKHLKDNVERGTAGKRGGACRFRKFWPGNSGNSGQVIPALI
jgi:CobQ/CobB/MinD/ParA nucleotide binding domain